MGAEPRSGNALALTHASAIKGKTIVVTGVTLGGLGGGFVRAVAQAQPSMLILAGRSTAKLEQTAKAVSEKFPDVKVRPLELDLISLAASRKAAETVNAWDDVPQIDVLVNNAGVMATEWAASPEGHESQMAINHLGHFLFTNLIMGKLLKSPAPRIVIVSSNGHRLSPVRFDDPNFKDGKIYNKWTAYGQSKTANMLMAISLAEKLGKKNNLSAYSVQPGLVISNLGSHLKLFGDDTSDLDAMKSIDAFYGCHLAWIDYATHFTAQTPEQAASNLVYAAFDPAIPTNGAYLEDCRVASPWTDVLLPWATSSVEAERCWKLSEKLVGQEFSY
ncbi:NAD(P)-binding protein [Hypoxylon sp. FL1284]|nr:NAD(P)-binding protein [Hypoxylon sp. FL1284]